MNILMIYPEFPDTFWSFKHALNFVHRKASSPPLGLLTIASMLPAEWCKRLVDLNVAHLTQADLEWADTVFISAMVVQRDSAIKAIKTCKDAGLTVVAGGPLFTSEYETFDTVDHLILNEGELTLPPFLADLANGTPKRIYQSSEYADMQQSPVPMLELVDMDKYDSMAIQLSRGCPFNCEFCNITSMLGHKPRLKTKNQIIAELDKMYQLGWRRNVFFVDDNFIGNKRFLKEDLLPAIIEWRKGKSGYRFITEASINLADDELLMHMMAKAGFVSIFVGIETPDEDSLDECHKRQNRNRNLVDSVKALQHHGLEVMGGFIVGFDSDKPSIFRRQVDFIQKSGIITAMVGLLQAPNGTELYRRMERENRLNHEMTGNNTDGSTNIIPVMDLDDLKKGYREILDQIYSPKLFYERVKSFLEDYRPVGHGMTLEKQEILALFRSIYYIGMRGRGRRYYWRLFFWSLLRAPKKFTLAITYSIYGYHFHTISEMIA
jgi:radical SAM superfamily enzyme YgiQ (UPF0313 family)